VVDQSALNIVLEVEPGRYATLLDELATIRDGAALFAALENVHFARLLVIPPAYNGVTRRFGPKLVIGANYDGADDRRQIEALVDAGGTLLHAVLSNCVGFPTGGDRAAIVRYLSAQRTKVGAFYVNTIGRSVAQVAFEATLAAELRSFLDRRDWRGVEPQQVRSELLAFVAQREDLKEALVPAPQPSLLRRVAGYLLVAAVAVVGLVLALLLLPLVLLGIIVLRVHEIGNRPENRRPRDEHIGSLEDDEDFGAHNQLSAVGVLQRSPFRGLLLRSGLVLLQLGVRYVFNRGKLAEVDTIHFARWVLMDNGARLYFLSNYDGSPESYQDDFIERVAFGLNLVFSNGEGWPRTRFLLFGGASDELAFKAYYRGRQIPTQVWYVAPAYRGLTAVNVANNAEIRSGLSGSLSPLQCREWLMRF
jgi:hypothetical protein